MDKRMFFFSCFPSCLPKKNANRTRLSCGCITGAVSASKQAANTHKEKKKKPRPNFGEHCYSSLLSAVFSTALAALLLTSKMAPGLQSAARPIPLCHQIISAAQDDTARRCVQVLTHAFTAGAFGSNFHFQEFTQLGNRIPANLRVCVSSGNVLKSSWWRIRDCRGHRAPCNPAEV